ncbi:MAG: galactokinase [Gemmatimonadetes bacterium]|nr:galactokinase [Gemmatimonadota bacterium]MYJ11614.1 galactokinase [Gemmatimonadota bacterium]
MALPAIAQTRLFGLSWLAIAPGRVNLIGEHTDYNGLPVFPMAIDRDVRIEFAVADGPVVRLDSALARFDPFTFQLKRPIEAAGQGHWSNYVRAAAKGLLEHGVRLERGIEGIVTGNVPIASGLSSSSALVVASALALLKANGVEVARDAGPAPTISRLELAALMARAERFVGLEGGGMDQAACLHGVAGHALRIEFEPLRVTPVAVPEGWRWVVVSSLVRAEKSGTARDAYNERARQCREALELVRGAFANDRPATTTDDRPGAVALGYDDLVADADMEVLLRRARSVLAPVLFRRFRHVVTEGRRVALAEVAMRDGDMRAFGDLMVESHKSLRGDYEVSTPELNAIVEVALKAGAAGARLTGAGFGGCAVVLCGDTAVGPVMKELVARFYEPRLGRAPTHDEMFAPKPSGSARVQIADSSGGGL